MSAEKKVLPVQVKLCRAAKRSVGGRRESVSEWPHIHLTFPPSGTSLFMPGTETNVQMTAFPSFFLSYVLHLLNATLSFISHGFLCASNPLNPSRRLWGPHFWLNKGVPTSGLTEQCSWAVTSRSSVTIAAWQGSLDLSLPARLPATWTHTSLGQRSITVFVFEKPSHTNNVYINWSELKCSDLEAVLQNMISCDVPNSSLINI